MFPKKRYEVYGKTKKRIPRSLLYLSFSLIFIVFLLGSGYLIRKFYAEYKVFKEKVDIVNDPAFKISETEKTAESDELVIPEAKVLEMSYTVQAPLANWNIHDESCEEAALLMYHYYLLGQNKFNGKSVIPKETANVEEIKMKDWQVKNYGKEPDLSIEAWGKWAKEYYGHEYQIHNNVTKDDIKREIAKGNPVVVPVITHALQNPHYGRVPSYHVIVIKGYKADGVVANDPGVKEGENYFYSWDILFKAIDAQTPKMGQGRVMVTLSK